MICKKFLSFGFSACILASALLFTSCEEEIVLPNVTTNEVTDITMNSAKSGGSVIDGGGYDIEARGVVWSTLEEPTKEGATLTMTADGEGTGDFTSLLTDLDPETTYYVRAYATSSQGTGYGNTISFTTNPEPKPLLKFERSSQYVEDGHTYTDSKVITYTYNAQGLVASTVEKTLDTFYDVDSEITTNYTYNSNGEPTSWTVIGGWDEGTYTAQISAGSVTVTNPDGNSSVYTLNSDGKATKAENEWFTTTYTWTGPNLTQAYNILGSRVVFNTSAVDPVPDLGDDYWTGSLNLPIEGYLIDTSTNEEFLIVEYSYQFDGEGNVISGIETRESKTYTLTYTY